MSDFDRQIQARADLQVQKDAERLSLETAWADEQREGGLAVSQRGLRLGVQVVQLLNNLGAISETIWEPRVVGSRERGDISAQIRFGSISLYRYFDTGRGWHVYTHQTGDPNNTYDYPLDFKYVGIGDDARVFEFKSQTNVRHLETSRKGDTVAGLVAPDYLNPHSAIWELEGEYFQEGLASILRGNGPRLVTSRTR